MVELVAPTCVLADVLPDECSTTLHAHHVTPISLGGAVDGEQVWLCSRHHPMVESLARRVLGWRRCPHKPGTHRYPEGKAACERRLNRAALDR